MYYSEKIIVDADSCPVKREIVDEASQHPIEIVMVASYDHRIEPSPKITAVQVDRSDQSADLYISNLIRPGDIVITQDYGLASVALAKKATVISVRGHLYTDHTIDFMLENRHDNARLRRHGVRTKGPKPFTADDRKRFSQLLSKILKNLQENAQR